MPSPKAMEKANANAAFKRTTAPGKSGARGRKPPKAPVKTATKAPTRYTTPSPVAPTDRLNPVKRTTSRLSR